MVYTLSLSLPYAISSVTDFSWLRLMEDLGFFLFLSELALSCIEAGEREGGRGEGGEGGRKREGGREGGRGVERERIRHT